MIDQVDSQRLKLRFRNSTHETLFPLKAIYAESRRLAEVVSAVVAALGIGLVTARAKTFRRTPFHPVSDPAAPVTACRNMLVQRVLRMLRMQMNVSSSEVGRFPFFAPPEPDCIGEPVRHCPEIPVRSRCLQNFPNAEGFSILCCRILRQGSSPGRQL